MKSIAIALMFLCVAAACRSQTAGSLAVIAMQTDNPDQFVLLALEDIAPGTAITLSDEAWSNSANCFDPASNEGYITWTAGALGLSRGSTIVFTASPFNSWKPDSASVSCGTFIIGGGTNGFGLSNTGDQVLVFAGDWSQRPSSQTDVRWICAMSTSSFPTAGLSTCDLPSALTPYAVTFSSEKDNQYFANGTSSVSSLAMDGSKDDLWPLLINGAAKYVRSDIYFASLPSYTFGVVQHGKYYIDADSGNDTATGLSPADAWQSLAKVNTTVFQPGDTLLFHAGDQWTGQLKPQGSGTDGNPICISSYGGSALPHINGNGITGEAAVYLFNQEYWEINSLEISNDAATAGDRRGVLIAAGNFGTVHHIYLKNLSIHNIKGIIGNGDAEKRTAAIGIETTADDITPTRYDDVLIDGCTIANIENTGIYTDNLVVRNDYPQSAAWLNRKITRLCVRNNVIHHISKNAMIIRLADKGVVEHNVCYETATGTTGNTMFTASCDGTVFQYNEGYLNRGGYVSNGADGSMYDADLRSPNTVWQYSYSHDNAHGLFWSCTVQQDSGIICRYNISQNDKGNIFCINYPVTSIYCYNNVVYTGASLSPRIISERNVNAGTRQYRFQNNIIYNTSAGTAYDFRSAASGYTRTIDHNLFYGLHPASEPDDAAKLTDDPLLAAPGSGGTGILTLDGYKLLSGSPAINSGASIDGNGGKDLWGNTVPDIAAADRGAHEYRLSGSLRYDDEIFPSYQMQSDITYGESIKKDGTAQTLMLDFYTGTGDQASSRPLILFIHGGGFTSGDKVSNFGTLLCGGYARRGYAVASINYRLSPSTATHQLHFEAMIRALQDAKGAVRFFRKNAALFGIDTAKIFVTGSSAGSITALHLAYLDDAEVPSYVDLASLGGTLEGTSGSPGYSSAIQAVIGNWGAIGDTAWMKAGDPPVYCVHGLDDSTVYYQLIPADGPFLYGSKHIHDAALRLGLVTGLRTFAATGHTLDNNAVKQDSAYRDAAAWLASFRSSVSNPLPVELTSFSAEPRTGAIVLHWRTATETSNAGFSIERRHASSGGWIKRGFVCGSGSRSTPREYEFYDRVERGGAFFYRLKQIDQAGAFSYSAEIQVHPAAPDNIVLRSNYPNPFNPLTTIEYQVPAESRASLKVFDILGKESATLFAGITHTDEIQNVVFDGAALASGIYFAVLESNGRRLVHPMLLLR